MKIVTYISQKKLVHIAFFFLAFFTLSCEDVINVPLTTAPPRLVVDASINWEKGTTGATQKIILSTTTDYYGTVIPPVSGATVKVTNSSKTIFSFIENGTTGEYICTNFEPKIGETYVLEIVYKSEIYTATETMQSVSKITKISQKSDGGILKDQYEVAFYFFDPATITNYYLSEIIPNYLKVSTFIVSDDRFTDGKENSEIYSDKDLKPGNTVTFSHSGISKSYYNYMSVLTSIAGSSGGGGPFQTPPATVRGNVINQTKTDNYPLGYFSISETEKIVYTIK